MKILTTGFLVICTIYIFGACHRSLIDNKAYLIVDSNLADKTYRNPKSSNTFSVNEELLLKKNQTFVYSIRGDLMRKQAFGAWKLDGRIIVLTDSDTSKALNVVEQYDASLPPNKKRFFIINVNGNDIGYNLSIKPENKAIIEFNDSKKHVDLDVETISYFEISSVVKFQKYFPKPKSNKFTIKINPDKALTKNKWLLKNGKLFPLFDGKPTSYYLEEL